MLSRGAVPTAARHQGCGRRPPGMRYTLTPRVSAVGRPRGWGNTPERPSGCFGCKPESPTHLPLAPVATDTVQHSSVTPATAVTVAPSVGRRDPRMQLTAAEVGREGGAIRKG
eukprot:3658915-Pyramimonas_sp.AAC.1